MVLIVDHKYRDGSIYDNHVSSFTLNAQHKMCPRFKIHRQIFIDINTYLVGVWYVDRFSAFSHVPDDTRAPRYVYLFFLLHLLQRGPRTYVEQLGYQTLGLATLVVQVRRSWCHGYRRQRADIRRADRRPNDKTGDSNFFGHWLRLLQRRWRRRCWRRGRWWGWWRRRHRTGVIVIRNVMIAVGTRLHQLRLLLIVVVVTIMMMVMVMVMVDLRLTVRPVFAGRRGDTWVSGGNDRRVILAQTPDSDTGLWPPRTAHALCCG